jgi:hypothetical protein
MLADPDLQAAHFGIEQHRGFGVWIVGEIEIGFGFDDSVSELVEDTAHFLPVISPWGTGKKYAPNHRKSRNFNE